MSNHFIADALGAHPFFVGLSERHREALTACATHVKLDAGDFLFRAGDPADKCYAVFGGRAVVELDTGARSRVVETIATGDIVGWSWLFPPYRAHFDVRVLASVRAVMLDGITLRSKCDEDPTLGYELTRRVAVLLAHRLEALAKLLAQPGGGAES
jgi:CRP/FNR family transcriptional regulator, cyclic AMP receptor protein